MKFLHSRRFSVWLVSFLAVLVTYFIYNRMSRTPPITTSSSVRSGQPAADVCDLSSRVGMVGGVGVGTARNVRYTKLNKQKQVEREFGFEELLHQDGNDWEIEKPFYTIYGREFKSTISGEKAKVKVETSGGQVTPRDGVLTGSVTIRIWPGQKSGFSDMVIYLDDISFAGDRSLFSTPGLVELVSDDLQLTGTGMEIVYNGDAEKLEFLKIAKLKSLRIKRWSRGTVLGSGPPRQSGTDNTERKQEKKAGEGYKFVLDQNVVIETVQERLMAQVVSISDFPISGGSGTGAEPGGETVSGEKQTARAADGNDAKRNAAETAGGVTISCDGGILIVPMDSLEGREGIKGQKGAVQPTCSKEDGKTTFCGSEVEYNVATGAAVATGPSQIIFDVNGRTQERASGPATVTIVSQKQARFEPASNKVAFEGNCRCMVTQADVNAVRPFDSTQGGPGSPQAVREYIVTAEQLEVALKPKSGVGGSSSSMLDIERVVAKGGDVRLAGTRKAAERLLAGVEMKCAMMDYNAVSRDFVATGPGLIKMDNSQTDEPQKGLGRFSLRRKCYAFLRNFDSLQFTGGSGHLVADSGGGSLLVDYFPLLEKGKEDKVAVTASHVEADISETSQGRMELGGFTAKGAVTYEDKDSEVAGSEFIYEAAGGAISVSGDESMPCSFNGAIVDALQYNVKTGRWRTKIKGPGAIR